MKVQYSQTVHSETHRYFNNYINIILILQYLLDRVQNPLPTVFYVIQGKHNDLNYNGRGYSRQVLPYCLSPEGFNSDTGKAESLSPTSVVPVNENLLPHPWRGQRRWRVPVAIVTVLSVSEDWELAISSALIAILALFVLNQYSRWSFSCHPILWMRKSQVMPTTSLSPYNEGLY